MKLSDFDFTLPKELIAQKPCSPRDHCRLIVLADGAPPAHKHFYDILDFLHKGDVLVLNNSKVIPARLSATKPTGGAVEILLVRELSDGVWTAMIKNLTGREAGKQLTLTKNWHAIAEEKIDDMLWRISFDAHGSTLRALIHKHGVPPTPPYISRIAKEKEYQTVFASQEGSVAAPTAGFHFTKQLMNALTKKGIIITELTLHVGPGTFAPIRTEKITDHKMHPEFATISDETAHIINTAKKEKRRVITVGTTSTRTLESFADSPGRIKAGFKEVDIFMYPGYTFRIVDGLITNFHLPQSTLMLLVCAFAQNIKKDGTDYVLTAYAEAIAKKYQFYSFGDAMIIL
ncbi:MAG: tRNA preQ1(34) S-adenosylmethionine ribosyltransferase-isomerase QueA [bacterium]|nr:tRNA preQ1(34) S-adenosylmethionine ribosyltransferase-isomerase QueA [bacterium]